MDTPTQTVGLMTDPGLAEKVARLMADDLAARLSHDADEDWSVEVSREPLPLRPDGDINLADHAPEIRDRYGWDYIFYLTDLPSFRDRQPMLCQAVPQSRAALIVVPTLGAVRLRAQLLELVVALVRTLSGATEGIDPNTIARAVGRGDTLQKPPTDMPLIVLQGRFNQLRMLTGMVRGNRPMRLPGALSGFITAGAATGAFGIFYSSIWALADALHPLRLLLITAIVISLLTGWLIVSNGLWNRHGGATTASHAQLDNAATVITVGIGVSLTYLILFLGLFSLGVVVVEADYLSSQLQHPAELNDYVDLAWLASSLGTLAGALGTSFDDDEDVREATYSRRWHERRKMFDDYGDTESAR